MSLPHETGMHRERLAAKAKAKAKLAERAQRRSGNGWCFRQWSLAS